MASDVASYVAIPAAGFANFDAAGHTEPSVADRTPTMSHPTGPSFRPAARPVAKPAGAVPELTAADVLDLVARHAGDAALEAVRRLSDAGDCPPISLAADADDGAEDALAVPIRPNDPRRLALDVRPLDDAEADVRRHELSVLARQIAALADIDDRYRQLRQMALTDELTACANKRYFGRFLDRIVARARDERFPVTLLLFDIDNFKSYNDRHGHPVGDEILRQTADLIRRCVRDHDLVARIGGDEFAVVFWEKEQAGTTGSADATDDKRRGGRFPKGPLQIATRFRKLVNTSDYAALGESGTGRLSISGGMAVFPYDADSAEALVAAADDALINQAKRGGKNSIALVGGPEA